MDSYSNLVVVDEVLTNNWFLDLIRGVLSEENVII